MANPIRNLIRSARHQPFFWRYLFNLQPTFSYSFGPKLRLEGAAARVLESFNRDGVAVTHADKLLGRDGCFDEMTAAVDALEQQHAEAIAKARAHANDADAIGAKTFIYNLLGEKPLLDPESVFARFALQSPILDIANAYFGLYTQIRYYDVWHTLTTRIEARESQLWHRDREDYLICKVFVYLSDVDEGSGPFTYARRTHFKGNVRGEPAFKMEGVVKRSTDDDMSAVAPKDTWLTATGRRGTIIFADTRGYHKGGQARNKDRIMYNCMFTSPDSQVRSMMKYPKVIKTPVGKAQALALTSPHAAVRSNGN